MKIDSKKITVGILGITIGLPILASQDYGRFAFHPSSAVHNSLEISLCERENTPTAIEEFVINDTTLVGYECSWDDSCAGDCYRRENIRYIGNGIGRDPSQIRGWYQNSKYVVDMKDCNRFYPKTEHCYLLSPKQRDAAHNTFESFSSLIDADALYQNVSL